MTTLNLIRIRKALLASWRAKTIEKETSQCNYNNSQIPSDLTCTLAHPRVAKIPPSVSLNLANR